MNEPSIPADAVPARKPRIMGDKLPVPPPDPALNAPRTPRTMSAGAAPALVPAPAPAPAGLATATSASLSTPTPKPMRGQVRMGVKVRAEDLRRRFPEQPEPVLVAVATLLSGVVASTLDWTRAQSLGLDLQQRYGALVQQLLDGASADVVRTAPQHLSRLIALLETCAEDLAPASGIGQWLRRDKTRAVDLHRKEIEQLKLKLSGQMQALQAPMAELMKIRNQLAQLADDLMVAGLACDWLFDDALIDTDVRAVLADRALALTKTAGLVRQQQAQAMVSANQLDALRDRIQDGVLIALPTWLAHLASLPADLNATQRYVVRDDLGQILNRLKH